MKHKKKLLRWFGFSLLGLLLLLGIGYFYEPYAIRADSKTYPPPGKLVDVGGFRMHIHCMGKGSPTVIIDAGLGDYSVAWKGVQAQAAKKTQVCTFDRAGMGWSESSPHPRDAKQYVKELHALLHKAGIPGPYILAGHSMGGFTVLQYSQLYPSDVAGVVLLDSMSPQQFTPEVLQSHEPSTAQQSQVLSFLGRAGVLRAAETVLGSFAPPEDKSLYALYANPKLLQTFLNENRGLPESAAQVSKITSLGDKPLVVLSKGIDTSENKKWSAMQKEFLKLSTKSKQLTANKSGHSINLDQPEAAVQAINTMLELTRTR